MPRCTALPLLIFLLTLVFSFAATRAAQAADAWQISVLTFGPGPIVYERFGHNAIRVRNDAAGIDQCFDWGNFEFTPGFLFTFVRGDLNYWMAGGKPTGRLLEVYGGEWDRTVTEQILNLSPAQTESLLRALVVQDSDANRYYLYDYYRDNCSTRVRDALDRATNGALRASLQTPTPHSYRWHTRRLLEVGWDNRLMLTGIECSFGPRTDRPLTDWETCFLPMELSKRLDATTLTDASGTRVPFVRERRVLNLTKTPANAEPAQPGNPARWTLPFSLIAGALLVALARFWPTGFKAGATLWELFALFGAIFFPFIILFTRHWVVAWNENFLQFTPLAAPVLLALWGRSLHRRLAWAAVAAAGLSLVGALVTMSGLTPQQNAPAVLLALPLHLAVMIGLRWLLPREPEQSVGAKGIST